MAYSRWKLPQLCLQVQIFDFCCSRAGVLRHGERKASSRAPPPTASLSPTSGLDSNRLFPFLQPRPHCFSAGLTDMTPTWRNWPNISCKRGDYEHSWNTMWTCRLGLGMCVTAQLPPLCLCINLPLILGNSRQQCSAPRKRAGDVSFQCSGTCARVASSHRRAPYPKAPARPAPCPAVWSPSPVFQLR